MQGSTGNTFALTLLVMLLSACGGGGGDRPADDDSRTGGPEIGEIDASAEIWFTAGNVYTTPGEVASCSTDDLKRWVEYDMHDYYIYADSVPAVARDAVDDESALVRALRVDPDSFSSIGDAREFDDRYEEGIVVGYGFRWAVYDGAVRFLRVDVGSPADRAGLQRGDTLVALDGVAAPDLGDAEYERLYEIAEGTPVTFAVRATDGAQRDLVFARESYSFDTVPLMQTLQHTDGRLAGYLAIENFLEPTDAALDAAIRSYAAAGISELVLDLRYNGGGRVHVANRLAAAIGGDAVRGQLQSSYTRNERYARWNETENFVEPEGRLNLSRVVVLTTYNSASASELVINSLAPYIDVVVIGQRTRGKAFVSNGFEYCGKVLSVMNSIGSNAAGVSVLGGIEPTCLVEDTADFAIDDERDALRGAALAYLDVGTCPVAIAAKRSARDYGLPEDAAFAPQALR